MDLEAFNGHLDHLFAEENRDDIIEISKSVIKILKSSVNAPDLARIILKRIENHIEGAEGVYKQILIEIQNMSQQITSSCAHRP